MTEWRTVAVKDVAQVFDGPHATPKKTDDGPWYLSISSLKQGRFDFSESAHLSEADLPRWTKRVMPRPGDTLFSYETRLGDAAYWRHSVMSALGRRMGLLRPDPEKVHSRYLSYAYLGPDFQSTIRENTLSGSTVDRIPVGEMPNWPIRIPDLASQRAIAAVLGSIDDLIENNQRRVAVLEEMARAIYREWFVKFRYPGHEDFPLVGSSLGPIPEGWSASTCGVELNFIGGGTPSKKEPSYWEDGTVAWYTPTDLTRNGLRYAAEPALRITEQGVARSSARLFPVGSVLMTSRATLGVLAIATAEATTNQGFIVILPDNRWNPGFIYEWLDSKATELAALGTGATFKEITKGAFKSFPFVLPAQCVLDTYRATTDPIEGQVQALEGQIRRLSELRDLLLPKLVTGQLDVGSLDLDALVGEQVA